jgi:hypothetical protein
MTDQPRNLTYQPNAPKYPKTVGEELSGKVRLVEAPDRRRYLVNESDVPIPLRHQEHKIPEIPPHSIYQVGGVREKDWFSDMVRPVMD